MCCYFFSSCTPVCPELIGWQSKNTQICGLKMCTSQKMVPTVRSSLHLAPSRRGQGQPSDSWGPRVKNALWLSSLPAGEHVQLSAAVPKMSEIAQTEKGHKSNPTALLDSGTVLNVKNSPGCEITSLSSSLPRRSRCKPPPVPVLGKAKWASRGARLAAGASCGPAPCAGWGSSFVLQVQ